MDRECNLQSGFTLLEVIIAFTILALMAGMIFASLRLAVNAYERSQTRLEEEAERRVLFDQVKRQIGSLFPLRPTAGFMQANDPAAAQSADPVTQLAMAQTPLFQGEEDYVTFITLAPLILHESPGLTVVRYGLAQDEYGDFYLGSMETAYNGLESFLVMVENPRGEPLPLVKNVSRLEFEYYGFDYEMESYNWYRAWTGEEAGSVPEAIRINYNDQYLLVPVNASFFGGNLASGRSVSGIVGQ